MSPAIDYTAPGESRALCFFSALIRFDGVLACHGSPNPHLLAKEFTQLLRSAQRQLDLPGFREPPMLHVGATSQTMCGEKGYCCRGRQSRCSRTCCTRYIGGLSARSPMARPALG